jgi:hypothetical protein
MKWFLGMTLPWLVFLAGCERKDEAASVTIASEDRKVTERELTQVANPEHQNIARSVERSMESLKAQGGIIPSSGAALMDFDHPELSKEINEESANEVIKDSGALYEKLRDDGSYWNSDPSLRKSAIGIASIIAGLIGVPDEETVSGLPDLFINEESETKRDVLMLQAAKQAVRLAETRKKVSEEAFSKWLAMAESPNMITRYTALVLFDLVDPTDGQARTFFGAYSNEENEVIAQFAAVKSRVIGLHSE